MSYREDQQEFLRVTWDDRHNGRAKKHAAHPRFSEWISWTVDTQTEGGDILDFEAWLLAQDAKPLSEPEVKSAITPINPKAPAFFK